MMTSCYSYAVLMSLQVWATVATAQVACGAVRTSAVERHVQVFELERFAACGRLVTRTPAVTAGDSKQLRVKRSGPN